jgi:oleate hydratase
MNIYNSLYKAAAPEGIENQKAFIVGGGIAGMAAAAFLMDDAHMPGKNITVFEKQKAVGGSMDGMKDSEGYLCRGERELEPFMECLWYLCSKVPSLERPGRSVLDDVVDFNKDEPIHSECRALEKQGHIVGDIHDFKVSMNDMADVLNMIGTAEEAMEDIPLDQWFKPTFFESNLWLIMSSMLAFKPYHSAIEAKRYLQRFSHAARIEYLEGIVHTRYNEYDAIIKPLKNWLEKAKINIVTEAAVTDIELDQQHNTVQALNVRQNGQVKTLPVGPKDLVFFTNGSMTQNSCFGDNQTVAKTNRDTEDRGVFTLWEKLAKQDLKFGRPEKFISDTDRSKMISFFPTIKGYPAFVKRLEVLSGSKAGTGGAITIKDSNWFISIILHHKPFFPDQPDDVEVFWGCGLYGEREGNYIKKTMWECTGEEIMTELLYHLNMLDIKDDLLSHAYISTAMMPYIMSQFMPRKVSDRPLVVPEGCTNLAFIGQFVEVPGDVVFTVETSVRTAMEAVYKLTHLDKEIIEVYPSKYDIRYFITRLKKFLNIKGDLTEDHLPKMSLEDLMNIKKLILEKLNAIPHYPYLYTGRDKTVPTQESVLHPKAPLSQ